MIQQKKTSNVLEPNSTIARAYLLMDRLKCDSLPVESQGELVGVLSMNEIQRLVADYPEGKALAGNLTVGRYMKAPVVHATYTENLSSVIRKMIADQIQAIIVKDDDKIVGILSKNNLLEFLAQLSEKTKATVLDSLQALAKQQDTP